MDIATSFFKHFMVLYIGLEDSRIILAYNRNQNMSVAWKYQIIMPENQIACALYFFNFTYNFATFKQFIIF